MSIELQFKTAPAMPALLLRAAVARKPKSFETVPNVSASLERLVINPSRLAKYNRVCGFNESNGVLPATYPHIAAFSLHMEMLLHKAFPFAPMGIVHLSNRITQLRPIKVSEVLSLHSKISASRDTDIGLEVDIDTEAYSGAERVWSELTTVLKRGKSRGGKSKRSPLQSLPEQQSWELPANLGRQYAGVSGDYNPIHLFPASAKLLGFKRHIAHGMWSKARCLAALQDKLKAEAFSIEVDFKTPLFLPASVALHHGETQSGIDFSLRNAAGNRPHVNGRLWRVDQ